MAQVSLAPLAAGDNLIEIIGDGKPTLAGFRVVP